MQTLKLKLMRLLLDEKLSVHDKAQLCRMIGQPLQFISSSFCLNVSLQIPRDEQILIVFEEWIETFFKPAFEKVYEFGQNAVLHDALWNTKALEGMNCLPLEKGIDASLYFLLSPMNTDQILIEAEVNGFKPLVTYRTALEMMRATILSGELGAGGPAVHIFFHEYSTQPAFRLTAVRALDGQLGVYLAGGPIGTLEYKCGELFVFAN